MHGIKTSIALAIATVFFGLALAAPMGATQADFSFDFALESWMDLDESDGPVSLHRMRLNRKEGRLTKSAIVRPHNQEFAETIGVQIEYSNESDRKWKMKVIARWLDADGTVIDGFSATETLGKKSAKKIVGFGIPTLRYGLDVAKKLEIEIHYEP